jgi:tRNA threonylcarbamoyladenosine biosynthesis protein TsaB
MKILAIECSGERASVALLSGNVLVEHTLEGHGKHSQLLLPTVFAVLAEGGVELPALDGIAFGSGPGAFTSLRLACGVTQGLAISAGLGVMPVCSLAAMAASVSDGRVLAAIDARMGEVYCASYICRDGVPSELSAPACLPPEMLELPPGDDWHGLGNAFGVYADRLPGYVLARVCAVDAAAVPSAAVVARLAARSVTQSGWLAPHHAVPLYVRDKVALTTAERLARGARG